MELCYATLSVNEPLRHAVNTETSQMMVFRINFVNIFLIAGRKKDCI